MSDLKKDVCGSPGTDAPPCADAGSLPALALDRIAEVMDEGDGFWRACTGCQESIDGYVSTRDYPRSSVFRCQPGAGCRECGGLGVIWDNIDYGAMAEAMLADDDATTRLEEVRKALAGDHEVKPMHPDRLDRILDFQEHAGQVMGPNDSASLSWADQRALIDEAVIAFRARVAIAPALGGDA